MPRFTPKMSASSDLLLSNSRGAFLTFPTIQIRNDRHKEREIENPTKYHGFHWGTQKLVESWFASAGGELLSPENQAGFHTDLVTAEKFYSVKGSQVVEEIFVPDSLPAFAVSYYPGPMQIEFQPELDIRDRYAHSHYNYSSTFHGGICLTNSGEWWAAIGEGDIKAKNQYRYKFYPQDFERGDIAESWVHSPCSFKGSRFHFGFGKSREEALSCLALMKNGFYQLKREKAEKIKSLYAHHRVSTQNEALNRAFHATVAQFLSIQNKDMLPASGDRWFAGDSGWLRDAAISLEAYFELGLYGKAREILSFWLKKELLNDDGIFAEKLEPSPQWKGVDSTLWLLRRAGEYVRFSGDKYFLEDKGPLLRESLSRIIDKRATTRGLLKCNAYETWMDTKFTPREGYPVEIQALFAYDCLLYCSILEEKFCDTLARFAQASTNAIRTLYKCKAKVEGVERKYLCDCLSPALEKAEAITPNQLIVLDCGLADDELENDVLAVVRAKLSGKGVRTLAQEEVGYFSRHVGDCSYHRGSQWPLFNCMAAKAEIRQGKPERAFNSYIYPLMDDALEKNVGGIPELYNGDGSDAAVPKYQSWSMASFIVACKEYERASSGQQKLSQK
ncbi:Amylo-alpha-1,6-glucosidase [uncultured archaeon]|nr:Amylo-alpha-1,6-glucosidase [uncultured archaeon]